MAEAITFLFAEVHVVGIKMTFTHIVASRCEGILKGNLQLAQKSKRASPAPDREGKACESGCIEIESHPEKRLCRVVPVFAY